MDILTKIVADKRVEIRKEKEERSLESLREIALAREAGPAFSEALKSAPIGLIAEVKRKSPSAGSIREPFLPDEIARAYENAGVQAISVLMDRPYFGGGEKDFQAVRSAVPLPLLYKEFVVDEWQIWHAASLGASAVLLIARVLSRSEMERMIECCREARLQALVEVHDEVEMSTIAGLPVACVGVNNRDLKTFTVALETTLRLKDLAPDGSLLVSESGIRSPDDVRLLAEGGIDAVLVGEHLLRQPDPGLAVRTLMNLVWRE